MIRPQQLSTTFSTASARRRHRLAARIAGLAALLLFACCVARSDAQVATDVHQPMDLSRIVGTWYSSTTSHAAQIALDSAHTAGVVASVHEMLTTPKSDGFADLQTRVAPLRVDSVIHARRSFQAAKPEIRYTAALPPGRRRVLRAGEPAIQWVTERVTMWNDVVVDRQVLSREVVRNAKPAIVLQGTPTTLAQLKSSTEYHAFVASMTMIATAYTAGSATAYPTGYTATGVLARRGIVAVDPHLIPLGSTVFVPGYGIALAADTGGAIIGHRIDLCMDAYGEAMHFGRRTVQVYILKR